MYLLKLGQLEVNRRNEDMDSMRFRRQGTLSDYSKISAAYKHDKVGAM